MEVNPSKDFNILLITGSAQEAGTEIMNANLTPSHLVKEALNQVVNTHLVEVRKQPLPVTKILVPEVEAIP